MTTPPYSELVSAVRREGEGILTAAGMGLDADIPNCDGWTVAELVHHMTRIYLRVGGIVASRATAPPEAQPVIPDGDPIEVLNNALDELVSALSDSDAETPIWNWSAAADDGLFWARRMAHESSVHRHDVQAAHGVMQPIDAELAADGLDELIDVIAPGLYSRADVNGPAGTVALQSSDNGEWDLELAPTSLQRLEVLAEPEVTVRGTTSVLLLASYGRAPWTVLDVTGNVGLLTAWSAAMQF